MIFQTDYWNLIKIFFEWVAQSAGVMVFVSGFVFLSWLGFEGKRRKSFTKRKVEVPLIWPKVLKIISTLSMIFGIITIWSGAVSLILDIPPSFRFAAITGDYANHFTCVYLIVIGIAMFFKPIKDLPLASILGLIAGAVSAFALSLIVPDAAIQFLGSVFKWILVAVFIIIAIIVALLSKFYLAILQTISKVLSWPPIALVIAIFSFVQGIALWGFGVSIPNLLS
jgi:hypothetical protein